MIQLGARPAAGFDDPLRMLSDCHRRIEWFLGSLCNVAQVAGETLTPVERQALESALGYFATSGVVHTQDEEDSLFPRLRGCADDQPRVQAVLETLERLDHDHQLAHEEHAVVERLIQAWLRVGTLAADSRENLKLVLESLRERYRGHIELEDSVIFPLARRVLPTTEIETLGEEMRQRHVSCLR